MSENVLKAKSEAFADRILKLNAYLAENKREFVIAKQILRSGTSIGANISEAEFGASKADFGNKMKIARKECNETAFWLGRLKYGGYITQAAFESIISDCNEIGKLLTATIKTISSSPISH